MPEASFDKHLNLPPTPGKFVKLSKLGDKIRFIIAATPHYSTKHFVTDKDVVLCNKYNSEDKSLTCKWCEQYLEELETKGEKADDQLKPVTNFYYPILNLDTNKAQIFQFTAKSIHYTIKNYASEGVDVLTDVFKVERTEEKGNYYPVLHLPAVDLTPEQKEQLEIARKFKLSGNESGSVVVERSDAEE